MSKNVDELGGLQAGPRETRQPTVFTVEGAVQRRDSIAVPALVGGGSSLQHLTWLQVWIYGLGHVLNDMCASCWFFYLLVLLTQVRGMPGYKAGLVLLSGQVADALATPLVGYLSDRSRGCMGINGRKLFYLLGAVMVLVCFFFVFAECVPCDLQQTNQLLLVAYYSAAAALFNVGWAALQVSYQAMVPDMSPDEGDRVALVSASYFSNVGSSVLVFGLLWGLIHLTDLTQEQQFSYLGYLVLGLGGLASLVFFSFTHLPTREPKPHNQVVDWRQWLRVPAFYAVGTVYMSVRLVVNCSQVFLPFFVLNVLMLDQVFISYVPLTSYVASFFAASAMKRANQRFGRKKVFLCGALLSALALSIMAFLLTADQSLAYIFCCALLLGAGNATLIVCAVSLEADLIADHTEAAAFVYGVFSFADKLLNGVALFVLQSLNNESVGFTRAAIAIAPLAALALAATVVLCIRTTQLKTAASTALLSWQQAAAANSNPTEQTQQPGSAYMLLGSGSEYYPRQQLPADAVAATPSSVLSRASRGETGDLATGLLQHNAAGLSRHVTVSD
eukprot:g70470.t1